jgi:hypothetical protein
MVAQVKQKPFRFSPGDAMFSGCLPGFPVGLAGIILRRAGTLSGGFVYDGCPEAAGYRRLSLFGAALSRWRELVIWARKHEKGDETR